MIDNKNFTKDELLDRDRSSFDDLENTEDYFKVVSSFFETKDALDTPSSANNFLGTRGGIEALESEWVNALSAEVIA